MKKQLDIKKLLLLNLPYILMGLFATNFGEAWRMAVGADASAKMLSFFSTLPAAGGLSQKQERQEVSPRHGVRVRTMGNP